MTNDHGSTWAYATPGHASSLAPSHLKLMRDLHGHKPPGEDPRSPRDSRAITEVGVRGDGPPVAQGQQGHHRGGSNLVLFRHIRL